MLTALLKDFSPDGFFPFLRLVILQQKDLFSNLQAKSRLQKIRQTYLRGYTFQDLMSVVTKR